MLDEVEERGFAPVDVIEDDDQGARPSERREQLSHTSERLLDAAGDLHEPDRVGYPMGGELGARPLTEGLRQQGQSLLGRGPVIEPDDLFHRFGERPVRDALAVGQTTAAGNECTARQLVEELLDEP